MPFNGLADSEDFLVEAANTPAKLRMPLDAGAKFCDKGCDPLLELKEDALENIITKFRYHPSIISIEENKSQETFDFSPFLLRKCYPN